MVKYILHGGETSRPTKDNKKFFFEMSKGLNNPVNVLCVYFSRPKKIWSRLFKQDKKHFTLAAPTKIFRFVCASDNVNMFKKQILNADVIYMRGGKTEKLLGGN